jgi:hypothetical protein
MILLSLALLAVAYGLLEFYGIRPDPARRRACVGWLATMAVWGGISALLAATDVYLSNTGAFPLVIAALVPLAASAAWYFGAPSFRHAVRAVIGASPLWLLAAVHLGRFAAMGIFFKWNQGVIPLHYAVLGALPDLAFAISAIGMAPLAALHKVGPRAWKYWHVAGIVVFLTAAVSMHFSVPGPLWFFHGGATTSLVFRYPVALGPTLTVPLFILFNVLGIAARHRIEPPVTR